MNVFIGIVAQKDYSTVKVLTLEIYGSESHGSRQQPPTPSVTSTGPKGVFYKKRNTPCADSSMPRPATKKLPQNMLILTARILADNTTMLN